jgi:hypothetical protein
MACEASPEKRKSATFAHAKFVPSKAGRADGDESAAWQLRNFVKTPFDAVPNLAISNSAHFRKSKTQVGAFGKKMPVRQKTARDASGQNPTLGFHLNGPESTERSFLLTTS